MNRKLCATATWAVIFMVGLVGCGGQKKDVDSELQRAATAFDPANAAPVPAPSVPQQVTMETPDLPAQRVNQAMAAYTGGNYAGAVAQLGTLLDQGSRGKVPMTPQQYMALQDATGAVLRDLAARAAQGDQKAKMALDEYNRLRRVRR